MVLRDFPAPVLAFTRLIATQIALAALLSILALAEELPCTIVPPGEPTSSRALVLGPETDNGLHQRQAVKGGVIRVWGMPDVGIDCDGTFSLSELAGNPHIPTAASRFSRFATHPFYLDPGAEAGLKYIDPLPNSAFDSTPRFSKAVAVHFFASPSGPLDQETSMPKPWWQYVLGSVSIAALITVLGGGLLGTILAHRFDRAGKEREKLDRDRQSELEMAQVYLNCDLSAVAEMLEMVTSAASKAEKLVAITSEGFQIFDSNTPEQKSFRIQVRSEFNEATVSWYGRREVLGVKLGTYHEQSSAVFRAWIEVRNATTASLEKSAAIYMDYLKIHPRAFSKDEIATKYGGHRDAMDKGLRRFSAAIFAFRDEVARHYHVFMPGEELRSIRES